MVGRFRDEFEPDNNEDPEFKHELLSETQTERLKYSRLQSTQIIERDLSSYPEDQKNKALERYKLLSLVANELIGGWTPKNINPLIDKHFDETHLTKKPSYKSLQRWHKSVSTFLVTVKPVLSPCLSASTRPDSNLSVYLFAVD